MKRIWILFFSPFFLCAQPKGVEVVEGSAVLSEAGKELQVRVGEKTILNWEEFSIKAGEKTCFVQPHANSAVLNRVQNGISSIDGLLQANGRIYLLNPHGVVIGKEGVVSAAGFFASTLDLDNESFFQNQELLFSGKSEARIVNLGKIEALGGDVFLLGKAVVNEGLLSAPDGVVGIGAASEILLKPAGEKRIYISPKEFVEKGDGGIENRGIIEAARAELAADGNIYRFAINQEGVIEATGTKEVDGRIFLVAEGGASIVSGKMAAHNPEGTGGHVEILGEQVGLDKSGIINVSGVKGGGTVLLGGEKTLMSIVQPEASIFADCLEEGKGGRVVLWSDDQAVMVGTISVRGGKISGDGGFVEISGLERVCHTGVVDASAPKGKMGDLVLDPSDFTISTGADSGFNFNLVTGTFTPTLPSAVLNTGTLTTELGSTLANITITTASNFSSPGDITVSDDFSWATGTNLVMKADRDILIDAEIFFSSGNLILQAGRDITLNGPGVFSNSSGGFTINAGRDFAIFPTGVGDLTLESQSGDIQITTGRNLTIGRETGSVDPCGINTGGTITINTKGDLSLFGSDSSPSEVQITGSQNNITVGGNLLLKGGAAANATAVIGNADNNSSSRFQVGGNVSLIGGTGLEAFAQIGLLVQIASSLSGNITFDSIGGDLILQGNNAYAQIGHSPEPSGFSTTASGDISINFARNVNGGNIRLNGGSGGEGSALIGHGTVASGLGNTYSGNFSINALRDIEITSSSAAPAAIGFLLRTPSNPVTAFSSSIRVTGRNITLNGGASGQDAYIGAYTSTGDATAVTLGTISVEARGNLTFNPGEGAGMDSGAAAIGAFTSNGTATASTINIRAVDLIMNNSSFGTPGASRILTSDPNVTHNGTVSILADNLLMGGGGASQSAEIFGSSGVEVITNLDIQLKPSATIKTNTGDITLVVDNRYPNPPEIGEGRFISQAGATITAADTLRIFTAQRSQNTVDSLLNGAAFTPGPFLTNSATEQWGTYFPSSFGGVPFTIFYKTGVVTEIYNNFGIILSEMSKNLRTYDDLLFSLRFFLFGYDRALYDQLIQPRGLFSSFDLFYDEMIPILRQKYRNYHTKYVESF